MRIVRNMLKESSSHTNVMEQMDHRQTLAFTSAVELPTKINKMLNITVDEEHERRENDESRTDWYFQFYKLCNLPGPELKLKVPDAGYTSLYHNNRCSAQDRAWNLIHRSDKVC